jgi:hypothetical protein
MKKTLLLLFVCLFGALGGVKAYDFATPTVGGTYYLVNKEYGQFWYASSTALGSNRYYGVTGDLSKATPVTVESGYKLAFNVGGTTYRMFEDKNGNTSLNEDGMDIRLNGSPSDGYNIDHYWQTTVVFVKTDHNRYLRAEASESTCDWPGNTDGNKTNWYFVPEDDIANYLADVAETNYVSGWERVTSVDMLKAHPENYFFAIFSADALGLMVDASSSNVENTRPYYKTAVNPLTSSQYLFGIENYESDGFALKSYGLNKYFGNNSDSWNFQNLTEKEANCKLTITLNDGAFEIQSASADWMGRRYWGLYDYTGYVDGQKFAGNKNDAEKGSFLIYRIAKEGLNMTSCIKDPNLDGNLDDWEKTAEGGNGIVAASGGAESWNSSNFNFYQTLTNLPNGYYEIGVRAFYRAGNKQTTGAEHNVKLYAKTEEVAVKNINQYQEQTSNPGVGDWLQPTGESFYVPDNTDAANYALNTLNAYNNSIVAHVTDGTLTFGVKKETSIANDWSYWDTFTLTYLGENHVIIDDPETNIQTYEGTFTEDVTLIPTIEYPFVDITGATFTGDIWVTRANPNGLIYATPAQVAAIEATVSKTVVDNVISNVGNVCESLVITDGYPFFVPHHSNIHATEATYSRDIAAASNYGTICLPYAVQSNEDIQYYTINLIDGDVLKLTEVASVDAGKPAIFKKKNGEATEITAAASNVAVTDDADVEASLVGTFERLAVGDEGSTSGTAANKYYYIKNNEFVQGLDYFYINPFRAYIDTNDYSEHPARLVIGTDGTTAINELKKLDGEQGLKDGKYLIGGKIIVVKAGKQFNVNGVLK